MRILHVTPEAPGVTSGGKLGVLKSSLALLSLGVDVDYVGPHIEDETLAQRYHTLYELENDHSLLNVVYTFLKGSLNTSMRAFEHLPLAFKSYDVLYLDFSKQGYVIETMKKKNPSCRIITHIHNVEADYARVDAQNHPTIKKKLTALFQKRQEAYCVDQADALLVLTSQDLERLHECYEFDDRKAHFFPVCVNTPKPFTFQEPLERLKILLTGSLWFGPNVDGILWFIEKVLPEVNDIVDVTIAGAKPNDKLVSLCQEKGIHLVESPISMRPYFEACDMVAIPIFDGAGMKVKLAESLSYGKAVVSTSFGAFGYALHDKVDGYLADTPSDFVAAIQHYDGLSIQEKEKLCQNGFDLFCKSYSMDSASARLKRVLEKMR